MQPLKKEAMMSAVNVLRKKLAFAKPFLETLFSLEARASEWWVYEGYFKTPLRNLSIGGGSPATGLSIISSYSSLPKIILVETNILSRPIDRALVEAFGNNPSEPFKWFRPARAVISWAYYWIKFQSEAQNVLLLPRRQPATYDISQSVNDTIKEYTLNSMLATVQELFDLSIDAANLKGTYASAL